MSASRPLTRENLPEVLAQHGIPSHVWEGFERYIFDKIEPGSFLLAIFENDLVGAVAHADDINQRCLRAYASFLYNEMPNRQSEDTNWGSKEAVARWVEEGKRERAAKNALGSSGVDGIPGTSAPSNQIR